jgi:hypothetical protein
MTDLQKQYEIENQLEALIDSWDLSNIVNSLETICYGKAEHLAGTWQDHNAAVRWEKAGVACDRLYAKLRSIQLD